MRQTLALLLAGLLVVTVGFHPASVSAQARADSAVQFNVAEPPSGALDRDRLEEIAATIRKLERHPTAEGADKARAILVRWLQSSPDLSVELCTSIASPFASGESPAFRRALQQHLLSTAAYMIERPDSDDMVSAKLSGVNAALRVLGASGPASEPSTKGGGGQIGQLLEMREQGSLRSYVERGVDACQTSES